jgi:magnesium-transporting ATPase (P-type)
LNASDKLASRKTFKRITTSTKLIETKPNPAYSFDILNPNVLPDLGCTEHVFFDKTGTLVMTDYEIITVATNNKLYKSEDNSFLNDNVLREITGYNNTKTFGYKGEEDHDSGQLSEGSRRSQVSNPNYNFTIKMNSHTKNDPSKVLDTEQEGLVDKKTP